MRKPYLCSTGRNLASGLWGPTYVMVPWPVSSPVPPLKFPCQNYRHLGRSWGHRGFERTEWTVNWQEVTFPSCQDIQQCDVGTLVRGAFTLFIYDSDKLFVHLRIKFHNPTYLTLVKKTGKPGLRMLRVRHKRTETVQTATFWEQNVCLRTSLSRQFFYFIGFEKGFHLTGLNEKSESQKGGAVIC